MVVKSTLENGEQVHELLIKSGLYSSIESIKVFDKTRFFYPSLWPSIDLYCPYCGKISTFKVNDEELSLRDQERIETRARFGELQEDRFLSEDIENFKPYFKVIFQCAREEDHLIYYYFMVTDDVVIKVGQYPSIEDIQEPVLPAATKILSNEKLKELKRAQSLFARGIGVGSFVYLRRIVEYLVNKAAKEAIKRGNYTAEDIQNIHWQDKILKLNGYLPDYLVNEKIIYSILSIGIHHLSEKECREYYPIILSAINLIIREEAERQETNKEVKQIENRIARIKKAGSSKGKKG